MFLTSCIGWIEKESLFCLMAPKVIFPIAHLQISRVIFHETMPFRDETPARSDEASPQDGTPVCVSACRKSTHFSFNERLHVRQDDGLYVQSNSMVGNPVNPSPKMRMNKKNLQKLVGK